MYIQLAEIRENKCVSHSIFIYIRSIYGVQCFTMMRHETIFSFPISNPTQYNKKEQIYHLVFFYFIKHIHSNNQMMSTAICTSTRDNASSSSCDAGIDIKFKSSGSHERDRLFAKSILDDASNACSSIYTISSVIEGVIAPLCRTGVIDINRDIDSYTQESGQDDDAHDPNRIPFLHLCIPDDFANVIETLAHTDFGSKYPLDINTQDGLGRTIAHLICSRSNSPDDLLTLKESFPETSFAPADHNGDTPLHYVARSVSLGRSSISIYSTLLDLGADDSVPNLSNVTPKDIICRSDQGSQFYSSLSSSSVTRKRSSSSIACTDDDQFQFKLQKIE